jgi:hypothetical protein
MKNKYWFYLTAWIGCIFLASCGNDQKPAAVTSVITQKPVVMEPFRFHKLVEVSPGQDYDVLSWGRGSKDTGAFMILHSDSAARKYTTTTGDLNGAIVEVYNSDMDLDGNPEILIEVKVKDTVNYTNVFAFEFTNGKAQKLDFPKLTKSQKQGYRGNDNFYIEEGKLIREFPLFTGTGKDAKPTATKRKLEYGLRNNSFTVKQLSKDSVSTSTTKPVANAPVKIEKTEKKTTSTKKEKKHITEKKHKKKKKKRRNNSDEG